MVQNRPGRDVEKGLQKKKGAERGERSLISRMAKVNGYIKGTIHIQTIVKAPWLRPLTNSLVL